MADECEAPLTKQPCDGCACLRGGPESGRFLTTKPGSVKAAVAPAPAALWEVSVVPFLLAWLHQLHGSRPWVPPAGSPLKVMAPSTPQRKAVRLGMVAVGTRGGCCRVCVYACTGYSRLEQNE